MVMRKFFTIRSYADPTHEYGLYDLDKFRKLYRPGFYITGGTIPAGATDDEVADYLKAHCPIEAPPVQELTPSLADDEV